MREYGIDLDLEKEADRLIREGAKSAKKNNGRPYIRANGRGYQEYLDAFGIRSKKHDEKLRHTEITGLNLELSMRPIGERHSKRMEEE